MSNTDNVAIASCSSERDIDNMEEVAAETESVPEEIPQTGKRGKGKPVHPIWSDAFDEPNVHTLQSPNNAVYKHCKMSVRHHHKTLSVETHLRKCKPFQKIMMDKAVRDRPDWWNNCINKAAKKRKYRIPCDSSSSDLSLKMSAQSSLRSFVIPHLNASDQKKFNQYMAMQFYCTGTSFSRIEDPYLLHAVQLLRPGVKLPNRMQLANDSSGGLLECCYQKVKAEVNKMHLSASNQYICITSDAWSSILQEPIVNYMAACHCSWKLFTPDPKDMLQNGSLKI